MTGRVVSDDSRVVYIVTEENVTIGILQNEIKETTP